MCTGYIYIHVYNYSYSPCLCVCLALVAIWYICYSCIVYRVCIEHMLLYMHSISYTCPSCSSPLYVSIRQHTSAIILIRQDTSGYVRIRQDTSGEVSIPALRCASALMQRASAPRLSCYVVCMLHLFSIVYTCLYIVCMLHLLLSLDHLACARRSCLVLSPPALSRHALSLLSLLDMACPKSSV